MKILAAVPLLCSLCLTATAQAQDTLRPQAQGGTPASVGQDRPCPPPGPPPQGKAPPPPRDGERPPPPPSGDGKNPPPPRDGKAPPPCPPPKDPPAAAKGN